MEGVHFKIKFGLLLAGLVILFSIRHRNQVERQADHSALHLFADQVARLGAENSRLSNLVSAASFGMLAKVMREESERNELMRLRAEVTGLRKQNESEKGAGVYEDRPKRVTSTEQKAPAIQSIGMDSWAFVGYQTPADAFQSMMWAIKSGNSQAYLDSLTPAALKLAAKELEGISEAETSTLLNGRVQGLEELRLDRMCDVSDTEASFRIALKTDNGAVPTNGPVLEGILKFKNIGGQWKSTGIKLENY